MPWAVLGLLTLVLATFAIEARAGDLGLNFGLGFGRRRLSASTTASASAVVVPEVPATVTIVPYTVAPAVPYYVPPATVSAPQVAPLAAVPGMVAPQPMLAGYDPDAPPERAFVGEMIAIGVARQLGGAILSGLRERIARRNDPAPDRKRLLPWLLDQAVDLYGNHTGGFLPNRQDIPTLMRLALKVLDEYLGGPATVSTSSGASGPADGRLSVTGGDVEIRVVPSGSRSILSPAPADLDPPPPAPSPSKLGGSGPPTINL
jgi:hypothetical protein